MEAGDNSPTDWTYCRSYGKIRNYLDKLNLPTYYLWCLSTEGLHVYLSRICSSNIFHYRGFRNAILPKWSVAMHQVAHDSLHVFMNYQNRLKIEHIISHRSESFIRYPGYCKLEFLLGHCHPLALTTPLLFPRSPLVGSIFLSQELNLCKREPQIHRYQAPKNVQRNSLISTE